MAIQVTIFDESDLRDCFRGGWTTSWSSEETTEFLTAQLRREYGDEVQVKVVDLSDWDQRMEHEELVKTIESLSWPFPVVAIDGSSKLVRGLKFGEISKYINEIKAGSTAG